MTETTKMMKARSHLSRPKIVGFLCALIVVGFFLPWFQAGTVQAGVSVSGVDIANSFVAELWAIPLFYASLGVAVQSEVPRRAGITVLAGLYPLLGLAYLFFESDLIAQGSTAFGLWIGALAAVGLYSVGFYWEMEEEGTISRSE